MRLRRRAFAQVGMKGARKFVQVKVEGVAKKSVELWGRSLNSV